MTQHKYALVFELILNGAKFPEDFEYRYDATNPWIDCREEKALTLLAEGMGEFRLKPMSKSDVQLDAANTEIRTLKEERDNALRAARYTSDLCQQALVDLKPYRDDAERYRWLRDNAGAWSVIPSATTWLNKDKLPFWPKMTFAAKDMNYGGMAFEEALDATMQQKDAS